MEFWQRRRATVLACCSLLSACGGIDQDDRTNPQIGGYGSSNPWRNPTDPSSVLGLPSPFRALLAPGLDVTLKKDLAEFIQTSSATPTRFFTADKLAVLNSDSAGDAIQNANPLDPLGGDQPMGSRWFQEMADSIELSMDGFKLPLEWKNSLDENPVSSVSTWKLWAGEYPVVGAEMRMALSAYGETDFAQGNIPSLIFQASSLVGDEGLMSVEPHRLNPEQARSAIAQELNFHPSRVNFPAKSLLAARGKWIPVYTSQVESDPSLLGRGPAYPLEVILGARDGRLLEQRSLQVHLDATAQIFLENSVVNKDNGPQNVTLKNLEAPGDKLTHLVFKVFSCGQQKPSATTCSQQAVPQTPGNFTFPFEDPRYDEVVAYFAIDRSMDWYRGIMALSPNPAKNWGPGYPGTRADFGMKGSFSIDVNVRAKTHADNEYQALSNAAYIPSTLKGDNRPQIVIGTGWEEGMADPTRYALRHIGKDADVVMHEFGHHIMMRTLRDVRGEGGAMHEGFADYFTYAITGNNLLAEGIMPEGFAPNGQVSLRSGNKTGDIAEYIQRLKSKLGNKPHIYGELWGSALWKIRSQMGNWKNGFATFDKIVWEGIDLLKYDADYYDAIAALAKSTEIFAAVEKKNAKDLKEKMFRVFHEYGYLAEPRGDGSLPNQSPRYLAASGQTQKYPNSPGSTSLDKKGDDGEKAWYECGSVAIKGSGKNRGAQGFWLLLMLLPMFLGPSQLLWAKVARNRQKLQKLQKHFKN